MFKHHPDGYIVFGDGQILSLEEFLLEEPDYPGLPEGYIGREYVPGVLHLLYGDDGNYAEPRSLEWALGDRYLSKRETYFDNRQARRDTKIAQEEAEEALRPTPELPLTDVEFQALSLEEKVDYLFQRLSR